MRAILLLLSLASLTLCATIEAAPQSVLATSAGALPQSTLMVDCCPCDHCDCAQCQCAGGQVCKCQTCRIATAADTDDRLDVSARGTGSVWQCGPGGCSLVAAPQPQTTFTAPVPQAMPAGPVYAPMTYYTSPPTFYGSSVGCSGGSGGGGYEVRRAGPLRRLFGRR